LREKTLSIKIVRRRRRRREEEKRGELLLEGEGGGRRVRNRHCLSGREGEDRRG